MFVLNKADKFKYMRATNFFISLLLSTSLMVACNNNNNNKEDNNPEVNDTTSNNPTTDAMDYHPDQRQQIPTTDSSNTIGTDTINSSEATPNTGTQKSYNDSSKQK
jgi:hypothetical protein